MTRRLRRAAAATTVALASWSQPQLRSGPDLLRNAAVVRCRRLSTPGGLGPATVPVLTEKQGGAGPFTSLIGAPTGVDFRPTTGRGHRNLPPPAGLPSRDGLGRSQSCRADAWSQHRGDDPDAGFARVFAPRAQTAGMSAVVVFVRWLRRARAHLGRGLERSARVMASLVDVFQNYRTSPTTAFHCPRCSVPRRMAGTRRRAGA